MRYIRPYWIHQTAIALLITNFAIACDLKSKVKEPPANSTPTARRMSENALESAVFNSVNQYRLSQNLNSLKLHSRISQLAREHSQKMARGEVPFSHDGFEERAKAISVAISYRSVAENVAYNSGYKDPAQNAVSGWIKSPGHQKNMVGKYNLTGVGIAKNSQGEYYFTQIFVYSP